MENDPWRNKNKVRVITVLDMSIGTFLLLLYIFYGFSFIISGESLPRGAMGATEAGFLASFLGISVLGVNIVQVLIALKLFRTVKPAEVTGRNSIRFSKIWFKGNIFFFILLCVKFILLILFRLGVIDIVLCFLEFLFRSIGWYFVKEFIDDLEAESSQGVPVRTFSMVPVSRILPPDEEQN